MSGKGREERIARQKERKGAAIARFMRKRFDVGVVVVDSVEDPVGIAILREDGALLTAEQAEALTLFIKGYRVFGGRS